MKKFLMVLMTLTLVLTSCSSSELALKEAVSEENLEGVYLVYDTQELPENSSPSALTYTSYVTFPDREVVTTEEEGRKDIVIKLADSDYDLDIIESALSVEESGFVTIILFTNSGEIVFTDRIYVTPTYGHNVYFDYRPLLQDYGILD